MTPAPQPTTDRAALLARHTQIHRPSLTQDELDTLVDLLERADLATLTEVASSLPRLCIAASQR